MQHVICKCVVCVRWNVEYVMKFLRIDEIRGKIELLELFMEDLRSFSKIMNSYFDWKFVFCAVASSHVS